MILSLIAAVLLSHYCGTGIVIKKIKIASRPSEGEQKKKSGAIYVEEDEKQVANASAIHYYLHHPLHLVHSCHHQHHHQQH